MSCSVRRPLVDLPISRQMEIQNDAKFNSLIQDTSLRLRNCMDLINRTKTVIDSFDGLSLSTKDELDMAKKKAKRAKRNARKKEQRAGETENINPEIRIHSYINETQIGVIMDLIGKELSEPYTIYTYRYFLNTWPDLTLLAYNTRIDKYIGVIVCKVDRSSESDGQDKDENAEERISKGYIAMLAVDESHRGLGIGTKLVENIVERMQQIGCNEIILETEVTNVKALNLYSRLGFIREKRLYRYYLNGSDAFRLCRQLSTYNTEFHTGII